MVDDAVSEWLLSVLVVENHIQSEDVPQFFLEFALELNLGFPMPVVSFLW